MEQTQVLDSFAFFNSAGKTRFDPTFDDRIFYPEIYSRPLFQVRESLHSDSFRLEEQSFSSFEVYGRRYNSGIPLRARVLLDNTGRIWMSDHPQERMMMFANARKARGSTLVGGLGLGIFPQYAQYGSGGEAGEFTIVERSSEVIDAVEPVLRAGLKVPFTIVHAGIEDYLSTTNRRFDTIFLDTWATLEPKHLPMVNSLKTLALTHLHWGGRILLWGYRWMADLFAQACSRYLSFERDWRATIIKQYSISDPPNGELLQGIESYYHGYRRIDGRKAEKWGRTFALRIVRNDGAEAE